MSRSTAIPGSCVMFAVGGVVGAAILLVAFLAVLAVMLAGCSDAPGHVVAIDARTGAELWRHQPHSPLTAFVADDRHVFVASTGSCLRDEVDAEITALSAETGAADWTTHAKGAFCQDPVLTASDGPDETVTLQAGCSIASLTASTGSPVESVAQLEFVEARADFAGPAQVRLNAHTCDRDWTVLLQPAEFPWPPAVDQDHLAVTFASYEQSAGGFFSWVAMFDRNDGHELWRRRIPLGVSGSVVERPALASLQFADGVLYVDSFDAAKQTTSLQALDPLSSDSRWTVDLGKSRSVEVRALGDALMVGSELDGTDSGAGSSIFTLMMLDASTGKERWRESMTTPGEGCFCSLPDTELTGSTLIIMERSGIFDMRVRSVDANTGALHWQQLWTGYVSAKIDGDRVYLANGERLAAIEQESGDAIWTARLPGHWSRSSIIGTTGEVVYVSVR